jgi:hypothetical protein
MSWSLCLLFGYIILLFRFLHRGLDTPLFFTFQYAV